MSQEQALTRRNMLSATGLVLASSPLIQLIGCVTDNRTSFTGKRNAFDYTSNLTGTGKGAFGDKDVNFAGEAVDMRDAWAGIRIWGEIPQGSTLKTQDGRSITLTGDNAFAYWSLIAAQNENGTGGEITPQLFPENQEILYGRRDGLVRVFIANPAISHLRSNRTYEGQMSDNRDGTFTLGVPKFEVPMVRAGDSDFTPYSAFINRAEKRVLGLVPVKDGFHYDFHEGRVELHGMVYEETLAHIKSPVMPQGLFTPDQLIESEAIYFDITDQIKNLPTTRPRGLPKPLIEKGSVDSSGN